MMSDKYLYFSKFIQLIATAKGFHYGQFKISFDFEMEYHAALGVLSANKLEFKAIPKTMTLVVL